MNHITNTMSRIFGRFAHKRFPKPFQKIVNNTYVKTMKLDMSEFDEPQSYETLNKLFIRDLKVKREIKRDKTIIYSMCDSLISECGTVKKRGAQALQIKGFAYSVDELLGEFVDVDEKKRVRGGVFANLYLSPADYHHYHSPCDMKILKAIHIPGKLYPVNFKWLNKKLNLFIENERVVLECETLKRDKIFLVFVGALNVGKMRFFFDENINTNVKIDEISVCEYEDMNIRQCEELGYFEMGSTVLFFGEEGKFKLSAKVGQKIRYGDILAKEAGYSKLKGKRTKAAKA